MSSFNDQLARMQNLISYGQINESEGQTPKAIEYQEIAADGKSYAIIKENAHYVIKNAPAEKAMVLEAYDYLDGWNHLDKHEYHSYNEAKKQFGFKMSSLNEAYNYNVNKDDVSAYANMELMTEGSESMMNEIARQKQIMFNAAAILNETAGICKKCSEDPERVAGNNDPDGPFTETAKATLDKDPKQASGKPEDMGEPYGEKGKAEKCEKANVEGSVACKDPKGGKAVKMNEADEKTFNAGLPSEAGVGSPEETKKHIMEDEDPIDEPMDDEILGDEDIVDSEEPEVLSDEDDEDLDVIGGEEEEAVDELDPELEDEEEEESIEDLKAQIEDLEARISELEDGEDDEEDLEDEDLEDEGDVELDDEEDADVEPEEEDDIDLDSEDDDFEEGDEDELIDLTDGSDEAEEFMESVINDAAKSVLAEGAFGDAMKKAGKTAVKAIASKGKELAHKAADGVKAGAKKVGDRIKYANMSPEQAAGNYYDIKNRNKENEFPDDDPFTMESKEKFMDSIVESVVNSIMEERTELHDFGKHPGYRKKPMELPETGKDQEGQYRDWNDESVHNEQPFGEKIGDGKPYDKEAMVQAVTEEVMKMIKKKA